MSFEPIPIKCEDLSGLTQYLERYSSTNLLLDPKVFHDLRDLERGERDFGINTMFGVALASAPYKGIQQIIIRKTIPDVEVFDSSNFPLEILIVREERRESDQYRHDTVHKDLFEFLIKALDYSALVERTHGYIDLHRINIYDRLKSFLQKKRRLDTNEYLGYYERKLLGWYTVHYKINAQVPDGFSSDVIESQIYKEKKLREKSINRHEKRLR